MSKESVKAVKCIIREENDRFCLKIILIQSLKRDVFILVDDTDQFSVIWL